MSQESECDEISNDNVPNAEDMEFSNKEIYHYKRVDRFFRATDPQNIEKMLEIINGEANISLRLFDWFVTRYAKKYNVNYYINEELFSVHISYKAQLKSFKKRYFDPFRRRKKFYYKYDKNDNSKKLVTTIGQLNFFRWAFINDVVKYVENNYKTILNAMILSNKEDKKRKIKSSSEKSASEKETKKENEIKSVAKVNKNGINMKANRKIKNDEVKIILSFD